MRVIFWMVFWGMAAWFCDGAFAFCPYILIVMWALCREWVYRPKEVR